MDLRVTIMMIRPHRVNSWAGLSPKAIASKRRRPPSAPWCDRLRGCSGAPLDVGVMEVPRTNLGINRALSACLGRFSEVHMAVPENRHLRPVIA